MDEKCSVLFMQLDTRHLLASGALASCRDNPLPAPHTEIMEVFQMCVRLQGVLENYQSANALE